MTGDVVITGYGVFTAFGYGADALRGGVFAGKHRFGPITRFDTTGFRGNIAGTHPDDPDVGELRQYPVLRRCAEAALAMAGLSEAPRAPVLVGTQGDHTVLSRWWRATVADEAPGPALPGLAAELPHQLAEDLGLGRPRLAFQNACVASADAMITGCRLIHSGKADVVVCGGAYVVDQEFFAKFDSGRACARDGRVRPFDRARSGLLLGDGAGVVVLESARHAAARGATPLVSITGWGLAADAYHVVRPHPEGEGLARAISMALRRAGLAPEAIGYVNAHGTGTPANDPAETAALRRALGAHATTVPISSTKGSTGHMLEASGVVELIITLLALREGTLPPTVGLVEPDPRCDLDYIPGAARTANPRRALTVNAGFGGLNSALVVEVADGE